VSLAPRWNMVSSPENSTTDDNFLNTLEPRMMEFSSQDPFNFTMAEDWLSTLASPSMTPEDAVADVEMVTLVPRLMVSVFNLAGNLLILEVIRKSRNFSQVTRHLIAHLACADILYGTALFVHSSLLVVYGTMPYRACMGFVTAGMMSGLMSCWGIGLVFLENFLSVRHILKTIREGLSLRNARLCMLCGWLVVAVSNTVYLVEAPKDLKTSECAIADRSFTEHAIRFLWVLLVIFSSILMVLMAGTLRTVNKHMNMVFPTPDDPDSIPTMLRQEHLKRRAKITRLFAIIAIGYVVSWGPLTIGLLLNTECPTCGVTPAIVRRLVSCTMINACMNVIVYVIKDNGFRRDVIRKLRCERLQVQVQPINEAPAPQP
jgi:hypothetical protein